MQHTMTEPRDDHRKDRDLRSRNLRLALILLSIAAVFFAGVIVNRMLAG